MRVRGFLAELKRRRVARVAVVYAVVAFVVLQAADIIVPALQLPGWTLTLLVVLTFLGFPIALVLAWAYDLTPEGVRRAEPAIAIAPDTARSWLAGALALVSLLLVLGAGWWFLGTGGPAAGPIERLAVLPPDKSTDDPAPDYFVEGMHDALISELGRVMGSNADVLGRKSVTRYRATEMSIPEIAAELDVDAIVESLVLRAGDSAVITARLTRAVPERQVWAGTYTRDLRDITALYTDVAVAVANEIRVSITPSVAPTEPVDPAAYDAFLLGNHYKNRLTEIELDMMRAIAYYERAIERDPDYAPAHAGIALAWTFLGWANVVSPDSAWPRMREAADRAWALNRDLPEVRLAAALKKRYYDWDWQGAREEYEQAIALNPSYADALTEYSWFLSALGDHERAIELARRAFELEPNDPFSRLHLPWALGHADRFEEAMNEIDAFLEDFPGYGLAPWYESHMYTRLGRYEDAIASMRTAMGMMQPDDLGDEYCLLAYLFAKLGRPDEAREQLAALDRLVAGGRYISPVPRSFAYIALEDHDRAMELLTEAYDTRAGWLAFLPLWREWLEPLEPRPDFRELADRLGFPNWP